MADLRDINPKKELLIMSNLNIKTMVIDTDRATNIVALGNSAIAPLSLNKGNEYIFQANCYSDSTTSANVTSFTAYDHFEVAIGAQYESNVSPVVIVTDPSRFNQVSDWTLCNVSSGMICARINTSGSALIADMGDIDSKNYQVQITLVNNVSGRVMISDTPCTIINTVEI